MIEANYEYSKLKKQDLNVYTDKIKNIISNFNSKTCEGNDYLGWYEYIFNISDSEIKEIKNIAEYIKKNNDVFVLCGIGGSYLGARAVIESIKGYFNSDVEILYVGNTFDERYVNDVLGYLKNKDFCVNVISKSGSTLETAMSFRLLRNLLENKYGEQAKERIFATTDRDSGILREIVKEKEYKSFVIPSDVGGRYSVFTPVGLLPIAVAGVDISLFVEGAKCALNDIENQSVEDNIACQYAAYRYHQYTSNKKSVETFVTYSPYLNMLSEWWKQLFGESEGKQRKGLYPASLNFSTDLHSMGQFIQEGSPVLFITQLKIKGDNNLKLDWQNGDDDNLNYITKFSFNEVNLIAQEGTNKAHNNFGCVDNFTFLINKIDEKSIGYLLFTLMYSCMVSAFLLEVNPFDQPGVEFYKREMKNLLKK